MWEEGEADSLTFKWIILTYSMLTQHQVIHRMTRFYLLPLKSAKRDLHKLILDYELRLLGLNVAIVLWLQGWIQEVWVRRRTADKGTKTEGGSLCN